MDLSQILSRASLALVHAGLPLVHGYHLVCSSIFLNTAAEDATGLEKASNAVLIPFQYLFAGNVAEKLNGKEVAVLDTKYPAYRLKQRFDYRQYFMLKTVAAIAALPISVIIGSALKGLSYLTPGTRQRCLAIAVSKNDKPIDPMIPYYQALGIPLGELSAAAKVDSPQYRRRPGDENTLRIEKEALKQIVQLLKEHNIVFWADCGTCLGAYRYGGVIPWDFDIDIGVLQPDFDNIRHALSKLDPDKYVVQDWSGRTRPETYLKVYVKETRALIDIYHFSIDPERKLVTSILSNEECMLLPESWKKRERRYIVPTPFDVVFPLKIAYFDGIELPIPNKTKEYLQLRYGENIGPVKLYNETTQVYEKDLSHPYWRWSYK